MPVNIKGKQYKTVAERVNEAHAQYPGMLEIKTELVSWEGPKVIVKATVIIHVNDRALTFIDYSSESEDDGFINKTSALENSCTSAIGRALAAAGFSGSEYCSANELEGALKKQSSYKPGYNKTQKVYSLKKEPEKNLQEAHNNSYDFDWGPEK